MTKKPITVLIVDDSAVARELLAYIIEQDPDLKVIGMAENGSEALKWLDSQTPDVITMDIQMPAINGFEVTQRIMETKPVPVVVITSGYTTENTEMAFRAIEAGALAILEKPRGVDDSSHEVKAREIINTIKTIAGIRLIKRSQRASTEFRKPAIQDRPLKNAKAIAIGASLGGPQAIAEILSHLPSNFPVPIFVVQHISEGFIEGFVKWLKGCSSLKIELAQHGEQAVPGHVYIAPDKCHMDIMSGGFISLDFTASNGPRPSVGRLFRSMAAAYGSYGVGVILTGMGGDGAKELLIMKQKGAYTIAQDESSSIMFGMPREAIILGAAREVLPLNKIAFTLGCLTANS